MKKILASIFNRLSKVVSRTTSQKQQRVIASPPYGGLSNQKRFIMKRFIYLILYLIFHISLVFAQPIVFQQEQYPFPVTFYGVEPQLGFISANNNYYPEFGDIDNDGDYDILMGTNMGKEYLIISEGNPDSASYRIDTTQMVQVVPDDYLEPPIKFVYLCKFAQEGG